MIRAADELAAVAEYDYAIVNEDLVAAVAQVAAILEAEARRVPRQRALPEFVEELRRDVIDGRGEDWKKVASRESRVAVIVVIGSDLADS